MLQAILHKKELWTPTGKRSEDALTSSTIGLLQYLSDETFWQILYEASEHTLPEFSEAGTIKNISFWKRMSAEGSNNKSSVEPDVWIKLERMHLIIEAKRYDGGGQYDAQWDREIKALLKHLEEEEDQPIDKQKIWLLALGGNTQTSKLQLKVKGKEYPKVEGKEYPKEEGKEYPIVRMHWQTLLEEVKKYTYESSSCSDAEKRICKDIIRAFEHFGFFALKWLDSLADTYKDTPARLASTSIDTLCHLPNYK